MDSAHIEQMEVEWLSMEILFWICYWKRIIEPITKVQSPHNNISCKGWRTDWEVLLQTMRLHFHKQGSNDAAQKSWACQAGLFALPHKWRVSGQEKFEPAQHSSPPGWLEISFSLFLITRRELASYLYLYIFYWPPGENQLHWMQFQHKAQNCSSEAQGEIP